MAKPIWSGTITFGLVSIPVKLLPATTSHDISFNLLHKVCKQPINNQYYCPHCNRVVERSELVRGYQYQKNQYVIVDEGELEAIKPESSSNLEIIQFLNLDELDPIYFEKSYYLIPDKGSEKSFSLLTKAMEETNRAAVGKLLMRNHEYLVLIRVSSKGVLLHLLLYEDEIRKIQYEGKEKELPRKEIQLAKELVGNLTEPFRPEKFKNDYIERLEEALENKIKGRKLTVIRPKAKPKVVNLMDALKKSVEQSRKGMARDEEREERPARLKKIK